MPIFIWDPVGGIVEWNRGCEELYGYTSEEAIGKHKEELLRTELPHSSFEELTNKLREEGMWTGELLHRANSGRVLTVEALIQIESIGGRQLAFESTRDITDRKSTEERRRTRAAQRVATSAELRFVPFATLPAVAGSALKSSPQKFSPPLRRQFATVTVLRRRVLGESERTFGIDNTQVWNCDGLRSHPSAQFARCFRCSCRSRQSKAHLMIAVAIRTMAIITGAVTSLVFLLLKRIFLGAVTAAAAPTVASLSGSE